ncbi:hypothetical protein, partial [Lancefieldella parvula]|uniref:hypothetical protein n=1 Tax=Lancefieldella parvula TaxID=1382 RepID=UPI003605B0FA
MAPSQKQYLVIDLKSFYASVECVERGLDPMKAKLVVLDTIYLPEERLIDKIEQISIADLISEAIIRIHEKRPLSPLFEMSH